jgi:S1-C subfamily serine protease
MRMITKIIAIGVATGLSIPLIAGARNQAAMKGNSVSDSKARLGTTSATSPSGDLALRSSSNGVIVERADRKAAELGLQRNDVIRSVDGAIVETPEDLMSVLRDGNVSSRHALIVVRSGKEMPIVADPAAWRGFLTPQPPEPPIAGAEFPTPPTPPSTN